METLILENVKKANAGFSETLSLTAHGKRLEIVKTQKPHLRRERKHLLVKLIKSKTCLTGLCSGAQVRNRATARLSMGPGDLGAGSELTTGLQGGHWVVDNLVGRKEGGQG